jgi:PRTRC genetic system protein E
MSFFASLKPLADRATIVALITADGDLLRVNVSPQAVTGEKDSTLHPLSLLASPEELDRDFAQAVALYKPTIMSVLEQAQAAADANGGTRTPRALPAPSSKKSDATDKASDKPAGEPARRGRRPKADTNWTLSQAAPADDAQPPDAIDPRQLPLPDAGSSAAPETNPSAAPVDDAAHATTGEVSDDESPAPADVW